MILLQLNQLPAELQAIVSSKNLAAGQILFAQHELAEAVFIVESGYIGLVSYTLEGKQINHYSVRAGESFAEVALFNERYVCTAIAYAPSRVWVLPKQPFLLALKQHPDLSAAFMEQLARRLHENKILLELRSIRSARRRVLHYLQLKVQPDGVTIHLDRSLKNIADDLGLTPEALSRALKQLQQEGEITRGKRKITLCKEFPKPNFNQGDLNAKPLRFRRN